MGAVVSLEVGKNRMEGLGDVAETADLIRYACTAWKPITVSSPKWDTTPCRVLKHQYFRITPVWRLAGHQPVQLPGALTGGPAGAALVAGNTVVMKPATDTPWTARLIC